MPVNLSRDDRYFADSFQSMPADGFTALFRRMLDHPLIEVQLGQAFEGLSDGERFEKTVFTGPIDEYFGGLHGVLPYRSQRFELVTHPGEGLVQARGTHNFPTPASRHPFTRSTEFRHLTGQTGVGATTVAFEYSEADVPGGNAPYYPIPREENRAIFRRYEAEAAKLKAVIFAGRLADYSYYNMDQAVARALSVFEKHLLPGG